MALIRRPETAARPTLENRRFSDLMDEFFNDVMQFPGQLEGFSPGLDIKEDDTHIRVKAYLPGMKKDDINVNLEGNQLTISGERKEEEQDSDRFHLRESRYGRFERSFTLPEHANTDHIEARYEDGVLHVDIEKSQEKTGKQIQVK